MRICIHIQRLQCWHQTSSMQLRWTNLTGEIQHWYICDPFPLQPNPSQLPSADATLSVGCKWHSAVRAVTEASSRGVVTPHFENLSCSKITIERKYSLTVQFHVHLLDELQVVEAAHKLHCTSVHHGAHKLSCTSGQLGAPLARKHRIAQWCYMPVLPKCFTTGSYFLKWQSVITHQIKKNMYVIDFQGTERKEWSRWLLFIHHLGVWGSNPVEIPSHLTLPDCVS